MAGLGRKIFNSGDILLASEVQGFLQDQSVMVFDDDAARTAAIATPTEGMVTFRKDDNALEVFAGSTFVAVGGGSEPGLVHIVTATGSGVAAINIDDCFTSTFNDYRIIFSGRPVNADTLVTMRLRNSGSNNSTTNYFHQRWEADGPSIAGARVSSTNSWFFLRRFANNAENAATIDVFNPQNAKKSVGIVNNTSALNGVHISNIACIFNATTSFDGFSLLCSGNFNSATVKVFGYRN